MLSEFGRRSGGGRRAAKRESAPLYAIVSTYGTYHPATVVDISQTGVRLAGKGLPTKGSLAEVKIEKLCAFGEVVWCENGQSAINFDVPLGRSDVLLIKSHSGGPVGDGLSLDERTALEEWSTGTSR